MSLRLTRPLDPSASNHSARRPTQAAMYYRAERNAAEVNETFLELVKDGMTREELARNIERRPSLWSRFSGWLDQLPSGAAA